MKIKTEEEAKALLEKGMRLIELKGAFGPTGRVIFTHIFGFDLAIRKADCDVYVAHRLSRFVVEEIDLKGNATPRPDRGWSPILMASTDTLELRGKPGGTWSLSGIGILAAPSQFMKTTPVIPCPTELEASIDCAPYVEDAPLEQRGRP